MGCSQVFLDYDSASSLQVSYLEWDGKRSSESTEHDQKHKITSMKRMTKLTGSSQTRNEDLLNMYFMKTYKSLQNTDMEVGMYKIKKGCGG